MKAKILLILAILLIPAVSANQTTITINIEEPEEIIRVSAEKESEDKQSLTKLDAIIMLAFIAVIILFFALILWLIKKRG